MKKWFRMVMVLTLLFFICGCSATSDTEYRHYIRNGLSRIKPSGYVPEVSKHDLEYIWNPVEFQSYEEMKNDVLTGNFTEEEMLWLRDLSIGVGYYRLAFDVNKPPIPVFPESWNLDLSKIQFTAYGFKAIFRKGNTEQAVVCTFEYHFQDRFKGYTQDFTVGQSGDFYNYILSKGKKTIYIKDPIEENSYHDLIIIGKINGIAFELRVYDSSDWLGHMPTDEELLQIDIQYLDLKS